MKRFNITQRGYKYDKIIFNVMFLVALVYVLIIMLSFGFDMTPRAYFNCLELECDNPFYGVDCRQQLKILFFIPLYNTRDCSEGEGREWVNEEKLPFGEYGELPPQNFFIKHLRIIILAMLLLSFYLNHFIHNNGQKFDIEIRISKKLRINRDWIEKRLRKQ